MMCKWRMWNKKNLYELPQPPQGTSPSHRPHILQRGTFLGLFSPATGPVVSHCVQFLPLEIPPKHPGHNFIFKGFVMKGGECERPMPEAWGSCTGMTQAVLYWQCSSMGARSLKTVTVLFHKTGDFDDPSNLMPVSLSSTI